MTDAGRAAVVTQPADLAADLARRLPPADVTALADAAGRGDLAGLRARAPSPVVRDACARLLATGGEPAHVAGLLAGAAAAVRDAAADGDLHVVWTGPDSVAQTGRLTGPAVTELVDRAARELLLVSYATHPPAHLAAALQRAADRGVDLTFLVERNVDNPAYTGPDDAFAGIPARRWCWPADRRPAGAALHAKLLVVDRSVALVGSANLTGRALETNLECGTLIRGGPHPAAICDHLWDLRRSGTLVDLGASRH